MPSPPDLSPQPASAPAPDPAALRVLYEDEDLVAVDKPVGLPTHSPNGARPGLVELLQARLGVEGLGVHQRLDAVTSGVIVFSRTPRAAQCLAAQFESRRVRKAYLALTAGRPEQPSGALRHRLRRSGARYKASPADDSDLGALAETRYEVVAQRGPYALWSLEPRTGRAHQLRVQLATEGCPVLGDVLYGGGRGTGRALLHAHELALVHPDGQALTLRAPAPPLLEAATLSLDGLLDALLATRAPWPADGQDEASDAFGLFTGAEVGVPGVDAERFGPFGVLHRYTTAWDEASTAALAAAVGRWAGLDGVSLSHHGRHDDRRQARTFTAPAWGQAASGRFVVREHGVRYLVDLEEKLGCGLYLDQHANRRWVMETTRAGDAVLNLFAYTCGFSAAAAAAGAGQVTSVDLSRRALRWGQDNFSANDLDPGAHRFFSDDAFEALARAARRGERYALVISDPPSFARGKKKGQRFSVEQDLARLTEACARVVAPGGWLLSCVNHRGMSQDDLTARTREGVAGAGREVVALEPHAPPAPGGPWDLGSELKSVRVQLR